MENKRINIVVLAKQVPDTKNVGKDAMKEDGTINRAALPAIFNPDDMKALEMALSCKDVAKKNSMDATVTVITMGPPRASEIIRESLYRGADSGLVISDKRFAASDTLATSYALSMAIRKLGKVDLIFSGRQAIDGDTAQVGPQTAEKLEVPQITNAVKLESFNGDEIVVSRSITNGVEVVKSPLPALITVHGDAKQSRSRHANLVIKNKKTVIPEWTADDIEPDFSRLGAKGSPTKVKNIENVVLTKKESRVIGNSEDDINGLMTELISSSYNPKKLKRMSEIKEKITNIIVNKLNVEPSIVTDDAEFINALGADSLDIVELIMDIEHEFNINIPDNMTEKIVTVGDAVKVVESMLEK